MKIEEKRQNAKTARWEGRSNEKMKSKKKSEDKGKEEKSEATRERQSKEKKEDRLQQVTRKGDPKTIQRPFAHWSLDP